MSFDRNQPSYKEFRAILSESTTPVVAWVGAGLSMSAGMPSWKELRNALAQQWRDKVRSMGPEDRAAQEAAIVRACDERDYWIALQKIHDGMGQTSFRDTIRALLREAPRVEIPKGYLQLWKLRIGGVVCLNLDRLVTRAFVAVHSGDAPLEFSGFEVGNLDVLKTTRRFIANLHGIYENHGSWVMTKNQLMDLMRSRGYSNFIDACLKSRTILFMGISADDIAVGGHLERLEKHGINAGTHFWLTDRTDAATDAWAERNGIRVIRYTPEKGHETVLDEIMHDLGAFVSEDEVAPPVVSESFGAVPSLPPVRELARDNSESIRRALNAHATALLAPETQSAYDEFSRFSVEYDEAIYRAWYASLDPPNNKVLGYELASNAGKGAFGTVYRASKDGKAVALKLLNLEVRRQPDMLQSFRRGVRSMKILKENNVDGMVPYIEASEIPTFVVMDWIDGPNLREAVLAAQLEDWQSRLEVAVRLARTIRIAHALPQRVLHRDLRPSNVMLRDFYTGAGAKDVVVLDFDLSWHLGSHEKTAMVGSDTTGYLAPEQLQRQKGVSTRHASVDAFGLGMTMFFMVSKRDPLPTEHNHHDWTTTVRKASRRTQCNEWLSLPERYARAILSCTRNAQNERWDMSQLVAELEQLSAVVADPHSDVNADMLAEEVVARTRYRDAYSWDEDKLCAVVSLPSGIATRLRGDQVKGVITAEIAWASAGQHSRKRVIKWLPDAGNRIESILTTGGWQIDKKGIWGGEIHFAASVTTRHLQRDIERIANSFDRALDELQFS